MTRDRVVATRVYAFVFAALGGVLLAAGSYVAGAVLVGLALALMAAWQVAERRGDDDRHTLL